MTNEQINRLVAEELGLNPHWHCPKCGQVDATRVTHAELHDSKGCFEPVSWVELDFCNDHNAVAEMRKVIKTKDERATFVVQLLRLLISEDPQNGYEDYAWVAMNTTPSQQAEAFLRMRGKWREE